MPLGPPSLIIYCHTLQFPPSDEKSYIKPRDVCNTTTGCIAQLQIVVQYSGSTHIIMKENQASQGSKPHPARRDAGHLHH